jgi:uncharacterized membrane protein HdeD (DUF308 family)
MTEPHDVTALEVEHRKRDSESFRILGGFLALLASIVILATFFQEPGHARVINLVAGLALISIGAGMFAWGLRLRSPKAG